MQWGLKSGEEILVEGENGEMMLQAEETLSKVLRVGMSIRIPRMVSSPVWLC